MFDSEELWTEAITAELQTGLITICEVMDLEPNLGTKLDMIKSWKPTGEFAETLTYANEQLRKYASTGAVLESDELNTYDPWFDDITK